MSRILKAFNFIFNSSLEDKKKAMRIIALAIRVSITIKIFPLRSYFFKYFNHEIERNFDLQPYKEDIGLIQRVLKTLPLKHTCLSESIIVHLYFRKKGIVVPIFLGINTSDQIRAHAWFDPKEENNFIQFVIRNGQVIEKQNKKGKVGSSDYSKA